MTTREDVLQEAASLMEIGIAPNKAVSMAWARCHDNQWMTHPSNPATALPAHIAYELGIAPNLSYTLVNEWRRIRKRGDYIYQGSLLDDFTHQGATASVCAKFLLALLQSSQLDRFPERLEYQVEDFENLEPLPSRATDRDPFWSPPAARVESEPSLFDPDLDEDPGQIRDVGALAD